MDMDNALSVETESCCQKKNRRRRKHRSTSDPTKEEATPLRTEANPNTKEGAIKLETEANVDTKEEATPLETVANVNTEAVPTSKKKKKRKKPRKCDNTKMGSTDYESASLKSGSCDGDLHPGSVVGISEETSLEKCPSESLVDSAPDVNREVGVTSRKKKRKKRSKGNSPDTEHENQSAATLESIAKENEQQLQDGPVQTGVERTTNLESSTDQGSALKTKSSEDNLHLASVVGTNGERSLERYHLESVVDGESVVSGELGLTSGKKKKKKRSKSIPEINNIEHENLKVGTLESTAKERLQELQDGPHQTGVEGTRSLESPTPNADLSCSKVKKKKKRKKNKKKQTDHESNDKVHEFLEGSDMKNVVLVKIESVQPTVKMSARTEPEAKHMDHALQQNVDVLSQGVPDAKHLAKDNMNFVTEVVGLNSIDIKQNSPTTDEQSGFPNGVNTGSITKQGDCTEVSQVLESGEIETHKRKKRKRSRKRKSSELGNTMQPVEDNDINDTSSHCLVKENTSGLLENIEPTTSAVEAVSEQVVDISNEKDSVHHSDIKPVSQESKKVRKKGNLRETPCGNKSLNDASELDVSKESYDQRSCGNLVEGHDVLKLDANFRCKKNGSSDLLKLDAVKIETTREESLSSKSTEVKDGIHLDASTKEGNLLQIPGTLSERTLVARSRKKLLILDVNGLLVDFVGYASKEYRHDITISKKYGEN